MFMTNKGYEKESAPVTLGLLVTLAEAYQALKKKTDMNDTLTSTSGTDQAAKAKAISDRLLTHGDNRIEAAAFILALQQENAELRREKDRRAPDRRESCKKCGYWVVRS
jgi:hypothetical protein